MKKSTLALVVFALGHSEKGEPGKGSEASLEIPLVQPGPANSEMPGLGLGRAFVTANLAATGQGLVLNNRTVWGVPGKLIQLSRS